MSNAANLRHNEDGSYTYGYEGSDGSFKLETRFADGRVQGKYGYIDVNGEVKIIEYGADAMGFRPEGDLPEGIIIPPPVEGDCTDAEGKECDYNDYDYGGETAEEETRRGIVNKARSGNNEQAVASERVNPNQNRGQQVSPPITPAPLSRLQTPQSNRVQQSPRGQQSNRGQQSTRLQASPPVQQSPRAQQSSRVQQRPQAPQAPRFRPPPAPQPAFSAFPASPAAPQPAFQSAPQQQAFLPTPPPQKSPSSSALKNPGSSPLNPSRGRGASGRGRPQAAPSRPQAAPSRQASSRPPPPPAQRSSRPSSPSSSSSGGFSNFPARGGGAPSRPRQEAPQAQERPRQQASRQSSPRLQERPAPALPPPSFQNFKQAASQTGFSSRPAPPPFRPALTFQDTPASDLPPSALEVVDFNELLGVFQGQSSPPRFSPSQSGRAFPAQAAVPRDRSLPGVFQSANFPVRSY